MKNTPESGTYREKEKRLAALFILPSLAVFLVSTGIYLVSELF